MLIRRIPCFVILLLPSSGFLHYLILMFLLPFHLISFSFFSCVWYILFLPLLFLLLNLILSLLVFLLPWFSYFLTSPVSPTFPSYSVSLTFPFSPYSPVFSTSPTFITGFPTSPAPPNYSGFSTSSCSHEELEMKYSNFLGCMEGTVNQVGHQGTVNCQSVQSSQSRVQHW